MIFSVYVSVYTTYPGLRSQRSFFISKSTDGITTKSIFSFWGITFHRFIFNTRIDVIIRVLQCTIQPIRSNTSEASSKRDRSGKQLTGRSNLSERVRGNIALLFINSGHILDAYLSVPLEDHDSLISRSSAVALESLDPTEQRGHLSGDRQRSKSKCEPKKHTQLLERQSSEYFINLAIFLVEEASLYNLTIFTISSDNSENSTSVSHRIKYETIK